MGEIIGKIIDRIIERNFCVTYRCEIYAGAKLHHFTIEKRFGEKILYNNWSISATDIRYVRCQDVFIDEADSRMKELEEMISKLEMEKEC